MLTRNEDTRICHLLSNVGVEGAAQAERTLRSHTLATQMRKSNLRKWLSPPTPQEEKRLQNPTKEILLYLSTLNIVVGDIVGEFRQVGLYRQQAKAKINRVEEIVKRVFNDVWTTIVEAETDGRTSSSYQKVMVDIFFVIDNAILLTPPERSWNIAVALCRLILGLNNRLGRYEVIGVDRLGSALKLLLELPNTTDHHLDNIIDRVLKEYE